LEDERGHQGTARYPIHKHLERHGMRLPYTHTHTHVTTVPARLRSNGLHPSSRSPSTAREPTTRRWTEERLRLTSLRYERTTTLPYWGRVWEDAACRGCHSPPCESPTATARSIGACWLSGLTASMRCPKPRSGPRRRSHYCRRAGMPTRALSLSYRFRLPPVHPASACLRVCLPACLPCPAALLRASVRWEWDYRPKRGSFAMMRTKVRLARAVGTMQE
jgi:hypothetical protein